MGLCCCQSRTADDDKKTSAPIVINNVKHSPRKAHDIVVDIEDTDNVLISSRELEDLKTGPKTDWMGADSSEDEIDLLNNALRDSTDSAPGSIDSKFNMLFKQIIQATVSSQGESKLISELKECQPDNLVA